MAEPARPMPSADARPRIHFRLRGDECQVSGATVFWTPVTDVIEGIDLVAGPDAHRAPAVIIWEGSRHDS